MIFTKPYSKKATTYKIIYIKNLKLFETSGIERSKASQLYFTMTFEIEVNFHTFYPYCIFFSNYCDHHLRGCLVKISSKDF